MFEKNSKNIIKMSRGDTAVFVFKLNLGTTSCPDIYELKSDDKVYFGVTEVHKPFEDGLIKKVISFEDAENLSEVSVKLNPEDTIFVLPGEYSYSLKLLTADGDVTTLIDRKEFILID